MQLRYLLIMLALAMVTWACNTSDAQQEETTEETTEAPAEEAADQTAPTEEVTTHHSGQDYTIKVVDADKASPRKEMTGSIAGANVSIVYGSPRVKGRTIFGGLEPWGKVWRAGADEATKITLDKDVMIEGQALAAGTYAYFIIPQEEGKWTVIFNKEADQWGAYKYQESEDALRVEVDPSTSEETAEEMDFTIAEGKLMLHWDKTVVPVAITAA